MDGPIGEGGMGVVYRARDTRLHRTVALKAGAGRFTDRVEREARAIAALNHPHICQVYDLGPDFLVMEFVDGRPLRGPVTIDRELELGIQILDALDAAHRRGIVHRDLKPRSDEAVRVVRRRAPVQRPDQRPQRIPHPLAARRDVDAVHPGLCGPDRRTGLARLQVGGLPISRVGRQRRLRPEFSRGRGKWKISTGGGASPRWRDDGKEIFVRQGGSLMGAEVTTSRDRFAAGPPRAIFEYAGASEANATFEVFDNGRRFIVPDPIKRSNPPLTVLLHWQDALFSK
ncbi:MAG TPA: serine/threonine-protein kinase [Vicinamibacterales bacterium]|nr:serine/threonine-protein kinase [Vicinamibacterales bacterium]